MIGEIASKLTPLNVAVGLFFLPIVIYTIVRVNYSFRIKRAGGVHAPIIADNPIVGARWLVKIGIAQYNNKLLELSQGMFRDYGNATNPNLTEINVTGGQRYLFTQEPEHVKTVLTGKFAQFGKGAEFHHVWKPLLGDSIFTTDGQLWQDSRNLLRPMFIKNRVSDLHIFERWTASMLDQFPTNGETVDIQDFFYRMTIDVITEFLLGESVASLENPRSDFVEAFADAQRWQTMLTVLIPIEKLVPRGPYLKAIKVIDNFVNPIINRALALSSDELHKLTKGDTEFTFLHAVAKYTRDPKVIRDQIIAILLAGRDTTAATLSWTLYELSNNPVIYSKLRKEILDICGPDREPTYDDLKGMKYLTNTLNEALRLYPAVPFNVRYALEDTSLPATVPGQPDVSVVKGDAVFYSTLSMQRREDIYPPPSESFAPVHIFQPERWETWQPRPWQYVPFNGGPRICVGQQFALVEMSYVLVRLCQRFEKVEYRGGRYEDQIHKVEIVGCPGNSVKVGLFAAKNGSRGEKA